jgi:glyoxylase-like metal-dependent hydrolase (beta-lactamase superfamily II)/8-oxo-dGTP pyrophosphatase MutT (NUDIX family)
VPRAEPPEPRASAAAILLDPAADDGTWRVLLGLRSRRAGFMPGHLSFPGGVMEPADRPAEPEAFARCASRELAEETGLEVPPASWRLAGERVTPPIFPIRFRTHFCLARLPDRAAPLSPASPENDALRLARPEEVLAEWEAERARLPPPILPLLRVLAAAGRRSIDEIARLVAAANAQEERAPRIEFAPEVWMLPVRTATLPPATHTNVWMPGGRRFVVIDPGAEEPAEIERLLRVIERRREPGSAPLAVLLTHHHRDHVGGAAAVARVLGLPIRAHAATLAAAGRALAGCEAVPVGDGDRIDLGGMTLEALHTPGHAAGHLAFHIVERGLLIAGDLISGHSTILIDPEQGDMDAYLGSLTRAHWRGCRTLLPGHGAPLAGRELGTLIEHRTERERRIVAALAEGASGLQAIARAAYRDTPGLPAPLIEGQTLAHLRRLERRGDAAREGSGWRPGGAR